jgi:hypothetical protein
MDFWRPSHIKDSNRDLYSIETHNDATSKEIVSNNVNATAKADDLVVLLCMLIRINAAGRALVLDVALTVDQVVAEPTSLSCNLSCVNSAVIIAILR